jgi:hypothetical protein
VSTESDKFKHIFRGLELAYGTYAVSGNKNGKQTGKASIVRTPRTTELWEEHLSGKGSAIGIIPINEESQCVWGCIDVDEYVGLDHKVLVEKIRTLEQKTLMKSLRLKLKMNLTKISKTFHRVSRHYLNKGLKRAHGTTVFLMLGST